MPSFTIFPTRTRTRSTHILLLLALFSLSACATDPMTVNEVLQAMPGLTQGPPTGIEMLEPEEGPATADETPGEEAAPEVADSQGADAPGVTAVEPAEPVTGEENAGEESAGDEALVTVRNRSVNIRSGPGLDFSVVFGAAQGDSFTALGLSEDEGWWQICCIPSPNDEQDNPTQKAWISNRVVTASEEAIALGVLRPLFPDDLTAAWNVTYQCGSERCVVTECAAEVTASVRNAADPRWLEIDRVVTWDEGCGEDSTWLHQIDRTDGLERYPDSTGLFFFNYWVGAKPGLVNSLYALDEAQVESWCSDPQSAELAEEGGWIAAYDGVTCYDVRSGMLTAMKYTKRWLFSGEFQGETYDKAYFGDFEVYEVALRETNVELSILNDE